MSALVGQHLGPYKLIEFLGEGGVASVYRARHLNEKTEVAIKIAKADITDLNDFEQRLKREALVATSLRHPHILKVFGYGQHGKAVYMVMQLLTGGNLAGLAQREVLSLTTISKIITDLASALDYIHARGIVHRDVKLENVLIDESGHPVLADFGMIKALDETIRSLSRFTDVPWASTRYGTVIGTPSYMSPEQCKSEKVDARSDVYSLGVVLFELLTGELPFTSQSQIEAMYMHIRKNPPLVSSIKSSLPPELDQVVQRALAKKPDERFASAGELALAFNAAVSRYATVSSEHYPVPAHLRPSSPTQITQTHRLGLLLIAPNRLFAKLLWFGLLMTLTASVLIIGLVTIVLMSKLF